MAVISITITQSSEQIVSGIPRFVTVSTNISAIIFYTLDGSDPTIMSTIYVEPISIPVPTNTFSTTLKVFASNGIDSSSILTETYSTNILNNARLPRAAVSTNPNDPSNFSYYPFGDNAPSTDTRFFNPADAAPVVYDPSLPAVSNAVDAQGNPTSFSNEEFNLQNYDIEYSTTNAQGEIGRGIGSYPTKTTIQRQPSPPEETYTYNNMFDPKALVIFQDKSKESPNDPPIINRNSFSMEDVTSKDGASLKATGMSSPPTFGSFIKSFYNPKDSTITYYYRDSMTNQWIISKQPHTPNNDFSLGGMIFSKSGQIGYVFQWIPFSRRYLT